MNIEERLSDLGIEIPEAPRPVAAYVPGVVAGNLVFVSGQLPLVRGELLFCGKLGVDLNIEQGAAAARQAVLNCLGVLKALLGDLNRIERIVKITGYVQSGEDFHAQPRVLNGASALLEEIFGERGRHARVAVGVNALPLNAPCEVELIAQIEDRT